MALYHNGEFQESLCVLEKSLEAGQGRFDAFYLFFLATCQARLGNANEARNCFDRAVHWIEDQKTLSPQDVEELKGFRAEAESVLDSKTGPTK
jgi:tetratricopeptide (TPR) repeat protein